MSLPRVDCTMDLRGLDFIFGLMLSGGFNLSVLKDKDKPVDWKNTSSCM